MRQFTRIIILFILVLIGGLVRMIYADTFYVTTSQDHVEGSLRATITMANNNKEDDTIYLPAGTYYLTGKAQEDINEGGDLDINNGNSITIDGDGAGMTIIDGSTIDRVLHVIQGTVYISGVTFQGGKTANAVPGVNNSKGEFGGGIFNNGALILTNCKVQDNITGQGGDYWDMDWDDWEGGYGGFGGGIYNKGTLHLDNCIITGNKTGKGGSYSFFGGEGGSNGGKGGGIYNRGVLAIKNTFITANSTGDGGQLHIHGGCGGNGGGIYNTAQGSAVMTASQISNNTTGDGFPEPEQDFFGGDGGSGGGIYNDGAFIISRSTISNNVTGDAGDGHVLVLGGGSGGGIYNNGTLSLTNSTVSSNTTGNGGLSKDIDSSGSGGYGGGIYNRNILSLINCTITNNITGQCGGNSPGQWRTGGWGGGIFNQEAYPFNGTVEIRNSIIANNHVAEKGKGPDCWGFFNSKGCNLVQDISDCTLGGYSIYDITGVDPKLGPLVDNGGETETHALLPGSPAIDAGYSTEIFVDQRGYTRPVDIYDIINVSDGADIGAYEFSATPLPEIWVSLTRLNFGGISGDTRTNSQYFSTGNSGGESLNWTISVNQEWITCSPYSGTNFEEVKVTVDTAALAAGTYTGSITVSAPGAFNSPRTIKVTLNVYNPGTTAPPFGEFSTPLEGTTNHSSIPVTGWVLDDIGVERVEIYNGEEYVGDAVLVEGARPDVEQAYPDYPGNTKAGWGYMLLSYFLPNEGNGIYTLNTWVTDREGNRVLLGSRTISIDNAHNVKPFGTIDYPEQGGIVADSEGFCFGWALTPLPNTIPIDGSTIFVFIDGVPRGNPKYNDYREDIARLFPGYNNSKGAGGAFRLASNLYTNGIHTISWSVTDDAGNTDGIGSRYFTIYDPGDYSSLNNSSALNVEGSRFDREFSRSPLVHSEPTKIVRGYNPYSNPEPVYPNDNGLVYIEINQLERVEIYLSEEIQELSPLADPGVSPPHQWVGFQVIGDGLRKLPIGSTLDKEKGIFYWQPGSGFLGDYQLAFSRKKENGERQKKFIQIRIK
jgi:hypothetical protein